MGLYSRYIFPRVMNFVMSDAKMAKIRERVLSSVSGDIFELGFGTGLNIPHYPPHVIRIVTADPNPGMNTLAERKIHERNIEVVHHTMGGESLPLEDESFDTVVCTFTLCSIRDVKKAMAEVWRILKPGGTFHFAEHGLADDPKVQAWQHRLNPIQKIIGDGCNLNRDITAIVRTQNFEPVEIENFYMERSPRFMSYIYQGTAMKP